MSNLSKVFMRLWIGVLLILIGTTGDSSASDTSTADQRMLLEDCISERDRCSHAFDECSKSLVQKDAVLAKLFKEVANLNASIGNEKMKTSANPQIKSSPPLSDIQVDAKLTKVIQS